MKRRKLWLNWLLVVGALGSLVAVWVTRQSVTSSELRQRERNLLRVFDEKEISRMAMEGIEQPFTLHREPGTDPYAFKISEPIEERAKPEQVSSTLSSLGFASFLRRVDEMPRAELGLSPPRWTLHVDHGNIRYRLHLGGKAPAPPDSSYLEVTGENVPAKGVFVVRNSLVNELTLALDDFRSHELAAIGQASLASVQLQDGTRQWTIANDSGRWHIAGLPKEQLADRERVERFFTQLGRLKLKTFLDVGKARASLGQSVLRLTLVPKQAGQTAIQIEIGEPCVDHPEWLHALRTDGTVTAGCVAKEIVDDLRIDLDALTEKHLFSLRPDEVESLELTSGDGKLVLTRSETGFRMTAPVAAEVERELGDQLLKDWLDLTGKIQISIADAAHPFDSTAPRATVMMRGVSDVPAAYREQRVELLAVAGKTGLSALRKADGVLLDLPQFDLNQLDVSGLKLRSRSILDLQVRQLVRIQVDTQDIHQVVTQEDAGPVLVEPPDHEPDGILLMDLIDTLRALRAARWVAAVDGGGFGLADPWVRVAFTVEASAGTREEHALRIGARTKGGFFAQLDRGPVFVLGRRDAETLSTWILDRAVFSPPFDDVTHIELRSQRGQLDLERVGTRFTQRGSQVPLSGAELEALLSELETLRPEAALHRGAALPKEGFARPSLRLVARQKGGATRVAWTIGAADTFREVPVYFARVEGIDATYVVARGPIQRILDVL